MAYSVKDILHMEVAPALGCTEPVAVALAAAAAASLLGAAPESVAVAVDPNVYKNGLAVAIPGTGGMHGLDTAAALGACGGDPARGLEVLAALDAEGLAAAKALLDAGRVEVTLLEKHGLRVEAEVTAGGRTARAVVAGTHDTIVELALDGGSAEDSPLLASSHGDKSDLSSLEAWLKTLELTDLLALLDDLDEEDMEFLMQGVEANTRLAQHGIRHGPGLAVGRTLERLARQKLMRRDMFLAARILTSAAADARMAGVQLPAMSSAGSGNHGLTAVLPIWAVKDFADCAEHDVLRSIALSHLVTGYIKAFTGRLSAVCGCSIAAGAGAAAGIALLLGGGPGHVAGAIKNLTEDLAGVICDGAKAGCALKLATAAGTAVQAALFSLNGVTVQATDGIIGATPEQTMQNMGDLSTLGMIETDRTILGIMLKKRFNESQACASTER